MSIETVKQILVEFLDPAEWLTISWQSGQDQNL
jgi:hypothetical protein